MEIASVYINLPIKDIARTRAFWTAMGFSFNEKFSDENALCLILKKDIIYSMLITRELFKTFTHRPIADTKSTQVLMAIEVESREKVDELMAIALNNGATRYLESQDHDWMYYDRFVDLDGHQWEVLFSDISKLKDK